MTKHLLMPFCGLMMLLMVVTGINAASETQNEPPATATEIPTETPTATPSATPITIRLTTRYVEADPRNPVVGEDFFLRVRLANESVVDLRNLTIYLRDVNASWALVPTDGLQDVFWTELLRGQSKDFERRFVYQPVIASGRKIEIRVKYEYTENQQAKEGIWLDFFTLQVLNPTATPTPSPTPTPTVTLTPTPIPSATPIPTPVPPEVVKVVVEVATLAPTLEPPSPAAIAPTASTDGAGDSPAAVPAPPGDEDLPLLIVPSQHLILDLGKTPLTVQSGEFFSMSLRVHNIGVTDVSGVVMTWQGFRYLDDGGRYIFIHASAQNWLLGGVHAGGMSIPALKTFFASHDAPQGVHQGELEVSYIVDGQEHYQAVFEINLLVAPK